jgi:hypothetical protein
MEESNMEKAQDTETKRHYSKDERENESGGPAVELGNQTRSRLVHFRRLLLCADA